MHPFKTDEVGWGGVGWGGMGWGDVGWGGRGVLGGGWVGPEGAKGGRMGGGGRTHLLLALVLSPLTTYPFRDGAPFLLLIA